MFRHSRARPAQGSSQLPESWRTLGKARANWPPGAGEHEEEGFVWGTELHFRFRFFSSSLSLPPFLTPILSRRSIISLSQYLLGFYSALSCSLAVLSLTVLSLRHAVHSESREPPGRRCRSSFRCCWCAPGVYLGRRAPGTSCMSSSSFPSSIGVVDAVVLD